MRTNGNDPRLEELKAIFRKEMAQPDGTCWLSWAVKERHEFLGVVITRAHGPTTAIARTLQLGINPGPRNPDASSTLVKFDDDDFPPELFDRLLSRDELDRSGIELCREHDHQGHELPAPTGQCQCQ
jgi:hypothetical protein